MIGRVWADNIEDPNSEESIKYGFWGGDGLLGTLLGAISELAESESACGYGCDHDETLYEDVYKARLRVFRALRAIEEFGQ